MTSSFYYWQLSVIIILSISDITADPAQRLASWIISRPTTQPCVKSRYSDEVTNHRNTSFDSSDATSKSPTSFSTYYRIIDFRPKNVSSFEMNKLIIFRCTIEVTSPGFARISQNYSDHVYYICICIVHINLSIK